MHGSPNLPQNVTKRRVRAINLTQVTKDFSDATYQTYAHGATHLLHDVIKSKMRVPILTQGTIPYLKKITNPWFSQPSIECNQKKGESN